MSYRPRIYISDELKHLSQVTSLTAIPAEMNQLGKRFYADFGGALTGILENKYSPNLPGIETDLALAYGIRNFAAHRIEEQRILYQKFSDLSQCLLNALFFAVEKLY